MFKLNSLELIFDCLSIMKLHMIIRFYNMDTLLYYRILWTWQDQRKHMRIVVTDTKKDVPLTKVYLCWGLSSVNSVMVLGMTIILEFDIFWIKQYVLYENQAYIHTTLFDFLGLFFFIPTLCIVSHQVCI